MKEHELMSAETIQKHFSDREWRLNNLYFVRDETGKKVQFIMNDVQKELHDGLWFFNIVPKARQLGITTFFTILYLDQILFSDDKTAVIIAHRQEDMKKIFRNKIKFAWDNLHPWLREYIGEPVNDSANELVFENGSSISVSMTTRSGTVQFLHISEFGYICQKAPHKAEEIVTGAINSVHSGNMVSIESTAAGREGYFYDFTMEAEKARKEGKELTPFDFKIFFFPWYIDKRYVLDGDFAFSQEMKDYFATLKNKHGIELSDAQKRWYVKKKSINKDKMFAEFPSTLEEAFSVTTEGSYYAREMNMVYSQQRIGHFPVRDGVPVDVWWDLGMNDYNVLLFTQTVGPSIFFVDMYYNHGYKLAHYAEVLKNKGYNYGTHYLPHDVEVRDLSTGKTRKLTLYEEGVRNIYVVPKTGSVLDGIDAVRGLFSRFHFDETRCAKLYDSLANYRKEWDSKLGVFKDRPRHDENSHFADAVRTGVTVWHEEQQFGSDYEREQWDKKTDQSFFA